MSILDEWPSGHPYKDSAINVAGMALNIPEAISAMREESPQTQFCLLSNLVGFGGGDIKAFDDELSLTEYFQTHNFAAAPLLVDCTG